MSQCQSYLLSIETVGKVCGISIFDIAKEQSLLDYVMHVPNMHDALLAEFVRRAMHDIGIESQHIKAIAVSEGPGSFTGIRIGMSFAKGWCADGKTLLLSVPTFHAMIEAARVGILDAAYSKICIFMKSHGDRFFTQSFDIHSGKEFAPISMITKEEAMSQVDGRTIIIGDIDIQDKTIAQLHQFKTSHPAYIGNYGLNMLKLQQYTSPLMADSEYHAEFIPTIREKLS